MIENFNSSLHIGCRHSLKINMIGSVYFDKDLDLHADYKPVNLLYLMMLVSAALLELRFLISACLLYFVLKFFFIRIFWK